jgi:hypothetical protein
MEKLGKAADLPEFKCLSFHIGKLISIPVPYLVPQLSHPLAYLNVDRKWFFQNIENPAEERDCASGGEKDVQYLYFKFHWLQFT